MYCMNCGTPNAEGARFCANCGQSLQAGEVNPGFSQSGSTASAPIKIPWKWIGVIGGGVVALTGIIVLVVFLVNGGFGVVGQLTHCDWYQPDQQMYLTFNRDGTVITHDSYNSGLSTFTYILEEPDTLIIVAPDMAYNQYAYRYVIDNDTLILYDQSGSYSNQTFFICQDYVDPEQREK